MNVRKADFAGSWYPGTESECLRAIEQFSRDAVSCPDAGKATGGIVPHAGWFFSGQIACNVIACVCKTMKPETWVVLGGHLRVSDHFYIMKEGGWSTPIGVLPIDSELAEAVGSLHRFSVETEILHSQDNTIELQLPFLKYFTPDSMILPVGIPPTRDGLEMGQRIAEASKKLGRQTAVLGSTDLTHYGYNFGFAPEGFGEAAVDWVTSHNDRRMVDLIVRMDAEKILEEAAASHNACCAGAVAAAVSASEFLGAVKGVELKYATSYDKHKNDSFVGYVGVVFYSQ